VSIGDVMAGLFQPKPLANPPVRGGKKVLADTSGTFQREPSKILDYCKSIIGRMLSGYDSPSGQLNSLNDNASKDVDERNNLSLEINDLTP
jgi:hypothetical protein